ncbi:MAG: hypothetical protein GF364_11290 [Candidatus Lokiarchaeota archaeon]|nr:hypothetical protein [Candidatus Lokiarchaeota archaeon]
MRKEDKQKLKFIKIFKISLICFVSIFWTALFLDFRVMFDNNYVNLWVHCPSIVEENEEFIVDVEAWDQYERLAGSYTGQVSLDLESYDIENDFLEVSSVVWEINETTAYFTSNFKLMGLYPAYKVKGADNGKKEFLVSISTPGLHYVTVTDLITNAKFRSNPILVKSEGIEFKRLYWGDIHGHSYFSDGSGHPNDVYKFARDVALIDFAALTDHAEMMARLGDMDIFNRFTSYKETTNKFNQDGKFTTLIALEWTPLIANLRNYLCTQHMNFYFEGNDMPFFSTFEFDTPDEVYDYIRSQIDDKFLAWTHHATRSDYLSDFAFYDDNINTMIEIYSCHGSCEFLGENNLYKAVHEISEDKSGFSVNDGLKMGRKFGFLASSDTHDGRLGHNILHTDARALNQYPITFSAFRYGVQHRGGLTGLYTDSLSRSNIFHALKNRTGFGTTWINRHLMDFSINGLRVGEQNSTLSVAAVDTVRDLEIFIAADGLSTSPNTVTKINKIQVFKNSELLNERVVSDFACNWTFTDTKPLTGTSYDNCIQKADGNWYIHARSIKPVDPAELNTGGADYYYVRFTDSNGGAGWIGPIWVEIA